MSIFKIASSLGHLRRIKDEPFIRSIRKKFQPYIILFTKYLALYKIECKTHYISLKKIYKI